MKKSTDGPFAIAKAGRDDLPALLSLYEQLAPDNTPLESGLAEERLAAFHAVAGSGLFVGHVGDTLVATCALAVIPNLTRGGRPYGLVENVVTHQDFRGLGYGHRILSHAVEHAWQQGCYKVMLLTGSQKPETHAFYRKAGFEASKTGYQMRRIAPRDG
jgi:GNAT superfamily N-acetyltransferase